MTTRTRTRKPAAPIVPPRIVPRAEQLADACGELRRGIWKAQERAAAFEARIAERLAAGTHILRLVSEIEDALKARAEARVFDHLYDYCARFAGYVEDIQKTGKLENVRDALRTTLFAAAAYRDEELDARITLAALEGFRAETTTAVLRNARYNSQSRAGSVRDAGELAERAALAEVMDDCAVTWTLVALQKLLTA